MSVAENMGFALKIAGVDKAEIGKRVEEAAKILDLEQFLDRKPKALSGGQRQRVAMGRAIVRNPQVFLMDEPLSNLDAKLRVQTRTQIAALQQRLGVTTVYVTHDQTEAMTMGDRVAVLKDGFLQQCATPQELYDRPVNVFVAGFIGSPAMNLVEVRIDGEGVIVEGEHNKLSDDILKDAREQGLNSLILGFRPEDTTVGGEGFAMQVNIVESLGADGYVYGNVVDASGNAHQITIRTNGRNIPRRGETIRLRVSSEHTHAFNSATGLRLGK